MTVISFRPKTSNIDILNSIENKTEFLNALIEAYKIMKLKQELQEGFSDANNYDAEWIHFDDAEYYNTIKKLGL